MSRQPDATRTMTDASGKTQNTRHEAYSLQLRYTFLATVAAALVLRLSRHSAADHAAAALSMLTANPPITMAVTVLAVVLSKVYLARRAQTVYLLDLACYKPGPEHVVTRETFMRHATAAGEFTDESLAFQQKILERSGLGQGTYLPRSLLRTPFDTRMAEARAEAEAIVLGAVDMVLAQTGVQARDIGIVVVNCGMFTPVPSLSATIVNHYKLRGDVVSYNLSGMGCSAGVISIDLAKHLLQLHRNTYALVVSLENITQNVYSGNNRSMLMTNCLFRMGGAAVVLSNRGADRRRAKYQLLHTVRTHAAAVSDTAYRSVYQQEDETGRVGTVLSKDLSAVAREALKTNIRALGPLVLPMSEQARVLASLLVRKVFGGQRYVPDFKTALEHFCVHPGGRAVLDTVEKSLGLSNWHMEPSRMTLYRWGNTSSSSVWYELAYTEAKGRVRRGHRAWQIAFGAGFKCNSAVWLALRDIDPAEEKAVGNPWVKEISEFPVEVPKIAVSSS